MKKLIVFAAAALFSTYMTAQAQQCQGNCVDIDMNIGPASHGGPITNPDWSYSHGSPNISPTEFWAWSANSIGEGMNYSGYNFIAGRQYCVSYLVTTNTHTGTPSDPSAAFNIIATNGPVVGWVTTSGGAPIPATPPGSQTVDSKPWGTFMGGGFSGITEWVTVTFTATSNFNNLWIFPSAMAEPPVNVTVHGIRICEITPCEVNFNVVLGEYVQGNLTTIDILTPWLQPGYYVCNEEIYWNGGLIYSGMPVSYLGQPGNYTVCVTICNKETGQRCRKCFDFCVGKWHTQDIVVVPSDNADPKSAEVRPSTGQGVPEEMKENPLDAGAMLLVVPNPSKGDFRLSLSNKASISSVSVYNSNGVLIHSASSNSDVVNMSLRSPAGMYIVKARLQDGREITSKLIIE